MTIVECFQIGDNHRLSTYSFADHQWQRFQAFLKDTLAPMQGNKEGVHVSLR